jgi:hypothetical protein
LQELQHLQKPHDFMRHNRSKSPTPARAQRLLLASTMKKLISKLQLKRETLRTLAKREVEQAAGGVVEPPNCTAVTQAASGCGTAVAEPQAN